MLDNDRNTPRRDGATLVIGVAGAVKIYAGALVAINKDGYAEPASESPTLNGLGRAENSCDNTSGGDDDVTAEVSKGVFRFDNHKVDPVEIKHIGHDCYMVDDHTVAFTPHPGQIFEGEGGAVFRPILDVPHKRGVAGKVFDVDNKGVWVRFQ